MHTRYFTRDEIRDLIEANEVSREYGPDHQWSRVVWSVVETGDGRYWRIEWNRGLTENGVDEWFDADYPEVRPVPTVRGSHATRYLTDEEACELPTMSQAANTISDGTFRCESADGDSASQETTLERMMNP